MTPRAWILLFILSITASGEAMLWALANGQFRDVERGRFLPLRPPTAVPGRPVRRHRLRLALYLAGIAAVALVCLWALGAVLLQATLLQP